MAEPRPRISIPPMILTIAVPDGPTVRLDYDGGSRGSVSGSTSITISDQGAARLGGGALFDLLRDAAALLFVYFADWEKWPAELRPANPEELRARIRAEALGQEPPTGA